MKAYIPVDYFKHTGYLPQDAKSIAQESTGVVKKERFNEKLDYREGVASRRDDKVSVYSKPSAA